MRRPIVDERVVLPDDMYGSKLVSRFINALMRRGKKGTAKRVVYGAFDIVKQKTGKDPLSVFETAINNVGPLMELRSRRVGGANYQVPREVSSARRFTLGVRWILEAAREKKGSSMEKRLAEELIAAFNMEGKAVIKRENMHKMAESNRAFAYLAW